MFTRECPRCGKTAKYHRKEWRKMFNSLGVFLAGEFRCPNCRFIFFRQLTIEEAKWFKEGDY